jgi:protein gp37
MENSKIEWTDNTFNPWIGCTRVSPGCDHCYAETLMRRYGKADLWAGNRQRTSATNWKKPLAWNRDAARDSARPRVFCASLSDVFDNQVPEEWRRDLFALIRVTPHLDWQLLTKRPQNIVRMLPEDWGNGWANVWLGCTVENQEEADRRIPHLLAAPARVRFLSCEPLLGVVQFRWNKWVSWRAEIDRKGNVDQYDGLRGIHWIICGGESGPGKRPFSLDAGRLMRDQCADAGVPFFFKQIDKVQPIPPDLMVRQFPVMTP